jgi:hypothetical protein
MINKSTIKVLTKLRNTIHSDLVYAGTDPNYMDLIQKREKVKQVKALNEAILVLRMIK